MNPAETFAVYAAACRVVGRGGITADEIRGLAAREDGIALGALEVDGAALAAGAAAAEEALSAQRNAAGMLAAAWRGRSASAATDLLERQCAAAAGVVATLVEAGEVVQALRGRLARLLEAREEAGVRIVDRRAGEHPRWLAWSRAVLAGTADPATAEAVAAQVGPYVEIDVAGDWVAAMTAVTDAVAAAYREAVTTLADRSAARFAIPSAAIPGVARGRGAPGSAGEVHPGAGAAAPPGVGAPVPAMTLPSSDALPFTAGLAAPSGLPAVDPPTAVVRTRRTIPDGDSGQPDPEWEDPASGDDRTDAKPAPDSGPAPGAPQPAAVAPPVVAPPVGPLPAEAGFAALPAEAGFGALPAEAGNELPPAEAGVAEPTPCETAADALPQVGP